MFSQGIYRSTLDEFQVIIAYPVVSTVAINDTIITSTQFHPYFPIIVVKFSYFVVQNKPNPSAITCTAVCILGAQKDTSWALNTEDTLS